MKNFKGTKGKWKVHKGSHYFSVKYEENERDEINLFMISEDYKGSHSLVEECEANALLISKAPQMLEEIQESLIYIQILRDQIAKESEINHRFEGMAGIIDNWINRKKQLIKEATEL